MVGQYITCHALRDQCCRIISTLLQVFRRSAHKDITGMLGEQLQVLFHHHYLFFLVYFEILFVNCASAMQFLVSKLVECCVPSDSPSQLSTTHSSEVLSLLRSLTVEADPSLHNYIRVRFLVSGVEFT